MKRAILFVLIGLLIILGAVFIFYKNQEKEVPLKLAKVSLGNVLQDISETGAVKSTEEITLSFEEGGKIEKIYVKESDRVRREQILVKLDSGQLEIQLLEAKAAQETAQAKLEQLLAGYSKEEIKIAKTALSNAKITLADAEQNLKDIQDLAQEDLAQVYGDALRDLDDIYLTSYTVFQDVNDVYLAYFTGVSDQDSVAVAENRNYIKEAVLKQESSLNTAKTNSSYENTDRALLEFKETLLAISNSLTEIKEITDKAVYSNTISSTHKNTLNNARKNIQTVITDITNQQQDISRTKLVNEANTNEAKTKVNNAKGNVQKAEDELALKEAGARDVDIALHQAQIKETEAKVALLENKIAKTLLKSPIEGEITDVAKEVGETTKAGEKVLTLISLKPFEIKADIYEEDIGKVKIGDQVSISLIAFPKTILKGKVSAINPAEKVLESVVYYEVTISFEELPENLGLKSGMTADITIKTASRENVLTIPKASLLEKDNETFVKVFKDGQIEERKIEIGLKGSDDKVEVISGLREGEEIVLP